MPKGQTSRASNKADKLNKKIKKLDPPAVTPKGDTRLDGAISNIRNVSRAVKSFKNKDEVAKLNKEIKKLNSAVTEAKNLKSTKRVMDGKGKSGDVYDPRQADLVEKANKNKGKVTSSKRPPVKKKTSKTSKK
jgi:C4-type Zn-finger protein